MAAGRLLVDNVPLPPQIIQALMARMGAQGPNGVPTSLSVNQGGGGAPAGIGGGIQGVSFPGAGNTPQNLAVGANPKGDVQDLKSGAPANQPQIPGNVSHAISSLTDLTEGVGPPPGTMWRTPTQGDVGNPAGPIGRPDPGAFDPGGGMPSTGATMPSPNGVPGITVGSQLAGVIGGSSTGRPSIGQTLPRRPANNSLALAPVFPQTGYAPYNGVLG